MKSCYGTIYPDLEQVRLGKPVAGKVFQILIDSRGPSHRDRTMTVDVDAWQKCSQCEDYSSCYPFSTAKLEMQRVLREL